MDKIDYDKLRAYPKMLDVQIITGYFLNRLLSSLASIHNLLPSKSLSPSKTLKRGVTGDYLLCYAIKEYK